MNKDYRKEFRIDLDTKQSLSFLSKESGLSESEFLCRLINLYQSDIKGVRSSDCVNICFKQP